MGKRLKVVAVLAVMAALYLLHADVALAQDTDGITVHCVNVLPTDPRYSSCQDHHPATPGCQAVLGIFVQSGNGGPGLNSNVAILNNLVDEYGKNGITANEPGTFVIVTNNMVTGRGATGLGDAAQNGVQIGFGGRGLVSGNTISYHIYVPTDFIAC